MKMGESPVFLYPLKDRAKDFLRIAPPSDKPRLSKKKKKKLAKWRAEHPEEAKAMREPQKGPTHFFTRGFIFKFAPTRFPNRHIHFGVSASTHGVSKLARDRNFAKRRLRALLNENARDFDVVGYDMVLIAKASTGEVKYEHLRRDMRNALAHVQQEKKRISNALRRNKV